MHFTKTRRKYPCRDRPDWICLRLPGPSLPCQLRWQPQRKKHKRLSMQVDVTFTAQRMRKYFWWLLQQCLQTFICFLGQLVKKVQDLCFCSLLSCTFVAYGFKFSSSAEVRLKPSACKVALNPQFFKYLLRPPVMSLFILSHRLTGQQGGVCWYNIECKRKKKRKEKNNQSGSKTVICPCLSTAVMFVKNTIIPTLKVLSDIQARLDYTSSSWRFRSLTLRCF